MHLSPLDWRADLVRERQLTDWRLRLEEISEEIQRELRRIDEMSAQADLEAVCEQVSAAAEALESFQEDWLE